MSRECPARFCRISILILLLALGPANPMQAMGWQELLEAGNTHRSRGDLARAKASYAAALDAAQGDSPEQVLQTRNAIAGLSVDLGHFVEAENYLLPALTLISGATPRAQISTLLLLGLSQRGQGRYTDAVVTLQRCLDMAESALGPAAASLVPVLNGLAFAYAQIGRHQQSRQLLRRAMNIPDAPRADAVETLRLSGELKLSQGDGAGAIRVLLVALDSAEKEWGADHLYVAPVLISLASGYAAVGRLQQAESSLVRVIALLTDALGNSHPHVILAKERLTRLRHAARRRDSQFPTVDASELKKRRK